MNCCLWVLYRTFSRSLRLAFHRICTVENLWEGFLVSDYCHWTKHINWVRFISVETTVPKV